MSESSSMVVSNDDTMVQLSVPGRFYPAVLQYLGELFKQEVGGHDVPPPELAAAASDDQASFRRWTPEDIRRLKSNLTNPTIRAVFDLTRGREDRMVSIREVEQHTGRKFEQVRADFGGFTRTCRNRLKKEHWPFDAVWAADGKEQMSYRVPDEVLRWWHEG